MNTNVPKSSKTKHNTALASMALHDDRKVKCTNKARYAVKPEKVSAPAAEDQPQPETAEDEVEDVDGEAIELRVKDRAMSLQHMMTHYPKNPHCPVCQRSKMQQAHCPDRSKRPGNGSLGDLKEFGDALTADHFDAKTEVDKGVGGETFGFVVHDCFTNYTDCFPLVSKHSNNNITALNDFTGGNIWAKSFHADGAPEIKSAVEWLGWPFDPATPGRPSTNGIAEGKVKRVLNGTRTTIYQSGLAERWWSYACRHFCLADNIYSGAWEKRFNKKFGGPIIPFGAIIDFRPCPTRAIYKPIGKFQTKAVPGIFLGYHLGPGGKWSKDYYVAEISAFQKSIGDRGHILSLIHISEPTRPY